MNKQLYHSITTIYELQLSKWRQMAANDGKWRQMTANGGKRRQTTPFFGFTDVAYLPLMRQRTKRGFP
jgi:hypothetical protein